MRPQVALGRKALKDFTFSNGLIIPAGYTVATSSAGVHFDPVSHSISASSVAHASLILGDI